MDINHSEVIQLLVVTILSACPYFRFGQDPAIAVALSLMCITPGGLFVSAVHGDQP
jgi:uncharacterized membrane protein YjjP (DUF1212 family)